MTMNVHGYAAQSAKDALASHRFVRRDPRHDDVVIEILYCGVCHSDLHQVRNDWGFSTYPMVPGHEIIGRVVSVKPGCHTLPTGRSCRRRLHGRFLPALCGLRARTGAGLRRDPDIHL